MLLLCEINLDMLGDVVVLLSNYYLKQVLSREFKYDKRFASCQHQFYIFFQLSLLCWESCVLSDIIIFPSTFNYPFLSVEIKNSRGLPNGYSVSLGLTLFYDKLLI